MRHSTSLVIIYNHYYPQNIDRLNELYRPRFPEIFHLVPFIENEGRSVVSVGRSSHNFQGYFFDARHSLKKSRSKRFLCIADDVLLNPAITSENVEEKFGLESSEDGFLENISPLSSLRSYWRHTASALSFELDSRALNISHVLPTPSEARAKLRSVGDTDFLLSRSAVNPSLLAYLYRKLTGLIRKMDGLLQGLLGVLGKDDWRYRSSRKLKYPFLWGYSDVFVLPNSALPLFSRLCGAFAAKELFVEVALPTALALSCRVVRSRAPRLTGQALWGKDRKKLDKFGQSLSFLVSEFPEDWLFVHPVKLSEWSD